MSQFNTVRSLGSVRHQPDSGQRPTRWRRLLAAAVAGTVLLGVLSAVSQQAPAGATVSNAGPGSYVPVTPSRLLDTRTGNGAPQTPLPAHHTITLTITGRNNLPTTGLAAIALT
ncbi:MAG: hypothetical protein M3Y89_17775, partial [Actinomycetota bacterium]|nr:hypothetical protein [Actinomycetota bacterium]